MRCSSDSASQPHSSSPLPVNVAVDVSVDGNGNGNVVERLSRTSLTTRLSTRRVLSFFFALALISFAPASRASPTPTSPASALKLDALMSQFRAITGLEAKFHEEKKMSLLAAPLLSDGAIYFSAPDRFVRETTAPAASTLRVDSHELRFGDASGTQAIPLDGNPVVRLFVDAFVKVLQGDREALERIFAIELKTAGKGWQLILKPKVAPMTQVIDRLELFGSGVAIDKMLLFEVDGDETDTVFSAVNTARKFSPAESARIFEAK